MARTDTRPTIVLRRAAERGHADHGWLDTHHTFSFADYHDPDHMGFGSLRVLNDDTVAPGGGFGTHPHRDMEIISIVLEGALAHRDSTGSEGVIRPGEVQRMTAGRGVYHSERNASDEEKVHFLQIWILPAERGLEPGYEQKEFPLESRRGRFRLVASRDGREGSLTIHQDASVLAALVGKGEEASYRPASSRRLWLHVARGQVALGEHELRAGDGAAISGADLVSVRGLEEAEVILFDLA